MNYAGTVKAFHYHLHQTDCWTPVKGLLQVALADLRVNSSTYGLRNTLYMGPLRAWQLLIPPGVAHGYKVIGHEDALLVYMTDRFYNPQDEGRIPLQPPLHQLRLGDPRKITHDHSGYGRRRLHRLGVRPHVYRQHGLAHRQPG
jgi:dTDP-4-dehydrorhamnose 3,5-epimerase-like enzyme